jgi:hypothetical protein
MEVEMPAAVPSRFYVGDISKDKIFSIEKLTLARSKDGKLLHAGESQSENFVKISENLIFGLNNEQQITDVYIKLD